MTYNLICEDISFGLPIIKDKSIHSIITSPPFFQLRDYGYKDQIGLEDSPEKFVNKLVNVFDSLKRVLRDDGTLWVNLGDTCASKSYGKIKKGDMIGIPWAFAFAMRESGWFLKSDVIWSKTNPIPSGQVNKPMASHEYFFLFSKSERHYYDAEATKENATEKNKDGTFKKRLKRDVWSVPVASFKGSHFSVFPPKLILPCIQASTSEHGCCAECLSPYERIVEKRRYATRPGKHNKIDETGFSNRDSGRHLTETWTMGWRKSCHCNTNEITPCVVLDPFMGSGTTGVVSLQNGRDFIGVDAKKEYVKLAEQRINKETILGVL